MIYHRSSDKQIVAVLIAFLIKSSSGNQPSYQASLFTHLQPQQPPIHICNGAIVQSRLVLTTASCLYYKMSPNRPVVPLEASMISVISGGSTKYHEELTLNVADIFVADNFNYTTGANDLAVLRLNGILPLDTRNDINWITLEDGREYDGPCLANFFERNSPQGIPNYIQSAQMPILESESCSVAPEKLIDRKNDICSLYYISSDTNCNPLQTVQNYNDDRGTGLVCGNKLIGLLSTILPWQNTNDCKDKALKAYYTAVEPHINWIFNIITNEDLKMYREGAYITSSPYAGEANAFIETQVAEVVTSTVQTTPVNLQATEPTAHHNSTAKLATINCQLLFVILGIIYICSSLSINYNRYCI